ncbi:YcbK family protein [Methylomonas sp. HW2-6]|uniref:YcbK family protein n=1 Tax=Methylomonas TaxID=416 RepID=UPI00112E06BF|nr:DUF882 domain-containing protein [Methylomonas koyamae]TPQ24734.1 hypothetical protein C2U68_18375 [Methylomonas koyamae]
MLRHNLENDGDTQGEVELSRRSFFGRLALGAVLSIAMPGVAHAAKSAAVKADKNHRTGKAAKSAARLPKHEAIQAGKAARHAEKKTLTAHNSHKSAKIQHGRIQLAHADHHAQYQARIRDVYHGKKHGLRTAQISHSHESGGRVHSVIRPGQREPMIALDQEPMFLADRSRMTSHRSLAFQNPHTGDKLNLTYFEKGRYLTDALDEISFLLRDYRTDDVHPIDPELLDQLHDLKQMLGLQQPFGVICGYRSPLTNAKLHAEHTGVANNSFHMHGRAVDIRIERFDLRRIHNAALAMHRGGVGYYPESNFIHLDTGTFRTWTF